MEQKRCGGCDKTDGLCYTSLPPRVKCTITGEYRLYDDTCNVNKEARQIAIDNLKCARFICEMTDYEAEARVSMSIEGK